MSDESEVLAERTSFLASSPGLARPETGFGYQTMMRSFAQRILMPSIRRWAGGMLFLALAMGAGLWGHTSNAAGQRQIVEIRPISPAVRWLSSRLDGWRLARPVVTMTPVEFQREQPARAALISEYGLRDVTSGLYEGEEGERIRVEVFRMVNYVAAYGAYSLERRPEAERVAVGTEGALEPHGLGFFKGQYYIRLTGEQGAVPRAALLDLAQRLAHRFAVRYSEIPVLIDHLPAEGMVPGTERFIAGPRGLAHIGGPEDPNDIFLLSSLAVEAVLAEYRLNENVATLMIVEYHTPQLAAAAYRQVRAYFRALPESERARRILKREGNFIIEAVNVQHRTAIQHLVDQITYAPSVHWLGKNPFEYLRSIEPGRPVLTIDWLLTTFGLIGLSLLLAFIIGVVLGVLIFLWRRRRFRYFPGFTDAGGMLRLNLDNLVLPPPEKEWPKRLPKNEG